MRPREIWKFILCLTGSYGESKAELTSPTLQPLILLRWKCRRKTTCIKPSTSQDTHSYPQPHRAEELLGFLLLFLYFPSFVINFSFLLDLQLVSHCCRDKIFIQNKWSSVLIRKSNTIFFFLYLPFLYEALWDQALQKETQVPFRFIFDCILLHQIPVHFHRGWCSAF